MDVAGNVTEDLPVISINAIDGMGINREIEY